MIKRNPLIKTKSQTTRKKEVKELLSDVGMNFFDNKEWEQFEVWPMGDKRGENSTYFTGNRSSEDLEDAFDKHKQWYINAEEALALGLVDTIAPTKESEYNKKKKSF